jgi:hypothetical protein
MGGGRAPLLPNSVLQSYPHTGLKFLNFVFQVFFIQSMDGPGSFKPVANEFPPPLPTLGYGIVSQ